MIEREKLQHLIENIGIPKLCLILLLGVSLIIVSIPSGKTKKNAQSTETTAKEDSTDLYVKKQEKRLVNALKHVEGVEEDGKKVPYVIKEVEPVVEGVVVVAQGGGNDIIKNQIVEAVSVLFHISSYKVKVLKMEDS